MKLEIEMLKKALSKKENLIPDFVVHSDTQICGFFGPYRWLSNFHKCPNGILYNGITYPNVENAFQACKWPVEDRTQFVNITAGEAKKLGKQSTNIPTLWDEIKFVIMAELVNIKFTTDDKLKQKLIDTGEKHLEERNYWHDTCWGTDENGVGQNNLGMILMDVRKKL